MAFGELALLHNAPRAATVVADERVSAFALDMVTFKMILMGKAQDDHKDYLEFLKVRVIQHALHTLHTLHTLHALHTLHGPGT